MIRADHPGPAVSADDEPRDVHDPVSCAVWNSNKPCNCGAEGPVRAPAPQLTTAERLDRIAPCPEPWIQKEGA